MSLQIAMAYALLCEGQHTIVLIGKIGTAVLVIAFAGLANVLRDPWETLLALVGPICIASATLVIANSP